MTGALPPVDDLSIPDGVQARLERPGADPVAVEDLRQAWDTALLTLGGLDGDTRSWPEGKYRAVVDAEDTVVQWSLRSDEFMFAVGVIVGAYRAAGAEPDELDAATIVEAARRHVDSAEADLVRRRAEREAARLTEVRRT